MPMLDGQVDAVIGVDTHRDRHAAAVLDPNGGVRATLEVPSDRVGYARLLRLAEVQAAGRRVWALEGTGCYGAGLTRFLVDQGEWVVEIDRPKRPGAATTPRGCVGRGPGRAEPAAESGLAHIVMLRQVHHGPTRAYTSRRIAQGKSQREIRRSLKRTIARQLYRLLERTATSSSSACVQQRGRSAIPPPRLGVSLDPSC